MWLDHLLSREMPYGEYFKIFDHIRTISQVGIDEAIKVLKTWLLYLIVEMELPEQHFSDYLVFKVFN